MDGECIPLVILFLTRFTALTYAHGRMIEPPNRASMWRFGYDVHPNYDDNGLNCGGFQVQWLMNSGRCGHCGDPYFGPREHEKGGRYASDVIAKTYRSGQVINVTIDITANHGGYFRFFLCLKPRLSQSCFHDHPLVVVGEGYKHKLTTLRSPLMEQIQIQLPESVTCQYCVLQWRWNCGQNYGMNFETGTYCKGCGPQEQFWNCADIAIEPLAIIPRPLHAGFNQIPTQHPTSLPDKTVPEIRHMPSSNMKQFMSPIVSFPLVDEQTTSECRGSPAFGVVLDSWCKLHCSLGFCPPSHCTCS